jgi:hypothetical protein
VGYGGRKKEDALEVLGMVVYSKGPWRHGLRDLMLFTKVMLGKQVWRLLTEPNSLCARVLKGRYIPDCDFWNAPRPRSSPFTWHNILFGKDLVQQGLRWGIRDGKGTKILVDNWIPDLLPERVSTIIPITREAMVDFLIDPDSGTWNESVIRSFFDQEVDASILRVPLSRHGGDDFASWPHARL